MAFDLSVWKERAAEHLRGVSDLVKRTASGTPYAVYAGLCTLSLWPLVEAAQQGELFPMMMALGSVAGSVGGNLIANQIQSWKDRTEAGAQAEAVGWIASNAPQDTQLRDA